MEQHHNRHHTLVVKYLHRVHSQHLIHVVIYLCKFCKYHRSKSLSLPPIYIMCNSLYHLDHPSSHILKVWIYDVNIGRKCLNPNSSKPQDFIMPCCFCFYTMCSFLASNGPFATIWWSRTYALKFEGLYKGGNSKSSWKDILKSLFCCKNYWNPCIIHFSMNFLKTYIFKNRSITVVEIWKLAILSWFFFSPLDIKYLVYTSGMFLSFHS